jgi:FkbM family methyltransferase
MKKQQARASAPYYSQYGEDRWITSHLRLPKRGVFVDVGGEDGITGSNSLHFELIGWTGVIIEPNPELLAGLRQRRSSPVIPCAIGPDKNRPFFIHPNQGWSGFDRGGRLVKVPVRRLDEILHEAQIKHIDLLSLDTEGSELDVWQTFDHRRWKPQVVIIEWDTQPLPSNETCIMDFFYPLPYRLVHRTPGNLIFERWPSHARAKRCRSIGQDG